MYDRCRVYVEHVKVIGYLEDMDIRNVSVLVLIDRRLRRNNLQRNSTIPLINGTRT